MNLKNISNVIEDAAGLISKTMYLRATDIEMNTSADDIDLSSLTVVIFNNLPLVNNLVLQSGYITQSWPIEIKIVRLAELDDTTKQSDDIRDVCLSVANQLFDILSKAQTIPDAFEYQVNFLNELKVYDKILTGCTLSFTLNTPRGEYVCY